MSVVNVDYRLAPQYTFPTRIEDGYDAFKWIATNATEIRADPCKGFIVGGVSAGANFTGVIAYLARDDAISAPITGLFLSIPCCLMPQACNVVPQWKGELLSMEQNKDSDMLDVRSYHQLIEDIYEALLSDPRILFLLYPDHSGLLKRAYFQICGLDPIRDEAFLFDPLLRKISGASTRVDIYDGLPHGFWRFQEMPAAKK
ncbi:MAG: hypothetical protein M1818_003259 [Claussenomyces sp. TS43310]|nr:MAG: hypothetical protein M1818_003259 [Claussenomyces sp. TS43310]